MCTHTRTQDTLRPRDFVDDFPLHLWLFLPRERRGAVSGGEYSNPSINPSDEATPHGIPPVDCGNHQTYPDSGRTAPLSSPSSVADGNDEAPPMISFVAHVPSLIRAELERLQFLFLLRLKDSFTELKTSAMRFLSLLKPVSERGAPVVTSPVTPRLGKRHDTLTGEEWESQNLVKPVLNSPDEHGDGREGEGAATIGGCVIVRLLQADILLPSMISEQDTPTGAADNTLDTPTHTPLLSPNSQVATPPVGSSPLMTPTRSVSPHPPVPPSPLTQHTLTPSHLSPPPHSYSSSPSETSQTSFESHMPTRTMSETRLTSFQTGQSSFQTGQSGSQISLPVLFETTQGQRSDGRHGDRVRRHGEEMVEGEFVMVHSLSAQKQVLELR